MAGKISHLSKAIEHKQSIRFVYRNYKDETGIRTVLPISLIEEVTDFHPDHQWLLKAIDLKKNDIRHFAVKDILTRIETA